MSKPPVIGFAILGLLLGTGCGGGIGLLGGLAYTSLVSTSSFEGYSGFVVVYWLLAGAGLGLIGGTIFGIKFGQRR